MKKTSAIKWSLLWLAFIAIPSVAMAQANNLMSYQTVVRNAAGQLVTNTGIGLKISILRGSPSGSVSYAEVFSPNPTTNDNGLLSTAIGSGNAVGGMLLDSINWRSTAYFVKTEIDPAGGTNYNINGTSQLLTVPYAARAGVSGSISITGDGGPTYTITHNGNISGGIPIATVGDGNATAYAVIANTIIDANSFSIKLSGNVPFGAQLRINYIVL